MAGQRDLRDRQSEEAQSIRSLRAHLASGQHPERKKKPKEEKEIITLFGVRFQKGETSQELHQWERVLGRKGVCYLFLIDNLKNILRSNIITLPPSLFSLEVLPYIPPLARSLSNLWPLRYNLLSPYNFTYMNIISGLTT